MQNNQSKKMAHGVMMVAIFTILTLIVFYVPIIKLIAYFIAPLPIAWYSAKYDRNSSLLMAAVSCIILLLIGGIAGLLIAIIFVATGLVIGEGLRTKKSKLSIYLSTAITILITFAIQYIILVKLFSIDFIQSSLNLLRKSYEQELQNASDVLPKSMSPTEILDYMFQSLEMAMPSIITLGIFFYSIVVILVIFPLLSKFNVKVPKFGRFSNLRLPRIVLWLYLIALIINFFAQPEIGTTLYVIVYNFSIILWILLTLQGLSFAFYCLEAYGLPKFLKGLTVIVAFPLYSLFILIGILDLGFNVRSLVKGKVQK